MTKAAPVLHVKSARGTYRPASLQAVARAILALPLARQKRLVGILSREPAFVAFRNAATWTRQAREWKHALDRALDILDLGD